LEENEMDDEKLFEAFSDYTGRINTYTNRQLILSKRLKDLITSPYAILKQIAIQHPEMKIDNISAIDFVNTKCEAIKNWIEETNENIDNLITYNDEMLAALKDK
jgi:hypothetical protein